LTIKAANSTIPGTYQVMINGTSSSILHSVTITITINGPTQPISFAIIVGGVIAVVATIGVVGYIVLRARRPKT